MKQVDKEEFKKKIKGKKIVFHKDFDKGMRLALCQNCGYPVYFAGLWDYPCECCGSKKVKIYEMNRFENFIFRLQEMAHKREKSK
jgi:Zn finger protein HypA/HybF involved in hydrogenase expression